MALSRRLFLASFPAACFSQVSGKGRFLPSAIKRYADPATEFSVQRLTDPAYSSILATRGISRHGYLVCASDASGRYEAYRVDLKSGQQKQLTDAKELDPHSLTLLPEDRGIVYMDSGTLMTASLSTLRAHEIYKIADGFECKKGGLGVAEDGLFAGLVERKESHSRLRLIQLAKGSAETLVEADEEISEPSPRPKRASLTYRRGAGLWLANYDGKLNYRLRTADGGIGPALWSPDGRSVFYLSYPEDAHKLHALREFVPDSNEDKAVANTSQFVGIGRNADASVFAGASGSKASPYVLLLVRAVKRELTLCEHRASDPAMVRPVFSPNSQRVFFGSDRHGKPTIYSIAVEKLVEETESA